MDTREIALAVLMEIETRDTFSNLALTKALKKHQFEEKNERAFLTRLVEGTMEYKLYLDYVLYQFSKTGIKKCKPLIRSVLRLGAYQILFMDRVPDSAACNEMVKLTKKHGFQGLSGFVNGVLRALIRGKEHITMPDCKKDPDMYLSVLYSTPKWLVEKLRRDYGSDVESILRASYEERKTCIRVQTEKISKEDLQQRLEDAGIAVQSGHYDEDALLISGYDFIHKIPGYREGFFLVQDETSMCAVRAAGITKGQRIMDVCAAPGGKTTAAAGYAGVEGCVISMDVAEDKLPLIEENVQRLGLSNVQIRRNDATEFLAEYEQWADTVIADVPCSGLGIMGRKNDIKYRISREQINQLLDLQQEILEIVHRYVKPGGTLLYSTCTINPEENQMQIEKFIKQHSGFRVESSRLFVQGIDQADGFFYAVLKNG